jgi:hypothetical protein
MARRAGAPWSGSPGTSGSRNATLRWTGPGRPPLAPAAAAQARQASDRQYPFMPGRASGTPVSQNHRTAPPYSLSWSMAWLAPVPRSSGGRSAVSTSNGTAASPASTTGACRLAAAVPEVQTTATGRPLALASPRAQNPAERSSIRTCTRTRGCSQKASASGALRDPGAITASASPHRASSSASVAANAVAGFIPGPETAQQPRPGPARVPDQFPRRPASPGPRLAAGPAGSRPRPAAGWW